VAVAARPSGGVAARRARGEAAERQRGTGRDAAGLLDVELAAELRRLALRTILELDRAAEAPDGLGQLGMCSRAPICKVVASATCRATPAALVADPSQAAACTAASTDRAACDFLGPSCAWVPVAMCIPR
jgi:hypothetical protein